MKDIKLLLQEHLQDWSHGQCICSIKIDYPRCMADHCARFCIAPLDVLKIRLQLQVYPVAGLGPQLRSARRLHAGTISTFKSILLNEGITVSVYVPWFQLLFADSLFGLGFLERQCSRRIAIRHLWGRSVLYLSLCKPHTEAALAPKCPRIFLIRCCGGCLRNDAHISS